MTNTAEQHSTFDQNCLTVLECYSIRDAAAKAASSEYAGWLDRLIEVPGLERASLTSIHGFLIAQGLIKFEFNGRSVGLQYQLSTQGRDCVARKSLLIPDDLRASEGAAESGSDPRSQAA